MTAHRLRGVFFSLALFLAGISSAQAHSIPGGASDADIEAAYNYQPMAAILDAPEIAYAQVSKDHSQMIIEYLPTGQSIDSWTHLVTVNLLASANNETLGKFTDSLKKLIARDGKVEFFNTMPDARKRPITHFCYTIGTGAAQEYNCGLIGEFSPGFVTSLQTQKRGGALTDEDKQKLQRILQKMLKPKPKP